MHEQDERRAAAIQRLEDKREWKAHAAVYVAVNVMLVIIWAASGAGYFWPIWPIGGWGLGLALHAWNNYGERPFTEADISEEIERDAA